MSLSTLQLASTSALALLAGPADVPHGQSVVLGDDLASPRLALNLDWKTKRTASDVLTELLDVDGVRVVADRHLWDRPDTLALRHDFVSDTEIPLYCETGIDRTVYLESRTLTPSSALATRRQRSIGAMAEVGASWRLTGQLNVEAGLRWMSLGRDARLVRTDAGWVSGDPVTLTLSLAWRWK
jgi:hypothetical protein